MFRDEKPPFLHGGFSFCVEGRIPASRIEAVEGIGHVVTVAGDWYSGQVTAARIIPSTGLLEAGASPRSMAAYAVGR